MFHRIPLCCKYIWTTSSVCWSYSVSNLPSFLRQWEIMWVTDFGEQILRVLKKQPLPTPPTAPQILPDSKGLMLLHYSTSANTISPTFPSNFTNSPDQSPEPISSLKRSTSCFVSLASSLCSLEQPSAPISVHIPSASLFSCKSCFSSHPSRTSHPLSLHYL